MYKEYPIMLLYSPGLRLVLLLALVWTLIWKGLALWRAGQNGQSLWFVVLFVVNTLGILDIVYLLWFARKQTRI